MTDEPRPAPGSEPLGELREGSASALRESEHDQPAGDPPPARPTEAEHDELLAVRRAKLDALRAAGIDPFPASFPGVVPTATDRDAHEGLEAGAETDATYRVGG
ncbi:MAG: lysyl-tRNA synthetase, class, partial [Baekduia sp.]|nr:lysyl-tRNA synthetase, class [Baekduia sp.]